MGWRLPHGSGWIWGIPLLPMGTFWLSCTKLHEAIELPISLVSGVVQDIGVLDGVQVPKGEEEILGFFCVC